MKFRLYEDLDKVDILEFWVVSELNIDVLYEDQQLNPASRTRPRGSQLVDYGKIKILDIGVGHRLQIAIGIF